MGKCGTCGQQTDYNGWPNRETWAAHLWLTNNQEPYHALRAIVLAAGPDQEWIQSESQEEIEDLLASMGESCLSDVGSFWRVDWQRIWEHMREGLHEEIDHEQADCMTA